MMSTNKYLGLAPALLLLSSLPLSVQADIRSDIIGTWRGPCLNMRNVNIKSTAIYRRGGRFEDKTLFYKDKGCKKPNGSVKINRGTYRIGRKVRTARGNTAWHIDQHITFNRYNNMRLPQVRIKNIVRVQGNVLTAGQLTPATMRSRPGKLALDIPFRKVR